MMRKRGPRQRDYPREILVGDSLYKIKFVKKITEPNPAHTTEIVGICDPSEKEILIIQGLGPFERLKAFIHEILHAIEFEHDIDIPHQLIYKLEQPIALLMLENLLEALTYVDQKPKNARHR